MLKPTIQKRWNKEKSHWNFLSQFSPPTLADSFPEIAILVLTSQLQSSKL
jgi:hypothetical protein